MLLVVSPSTRRTVPVAVSSFKKSIGLTHTNLNSKALIELLSQ